LNKEIEVGFSMIDDKVKKQIFWGDKRYHSLDYYLKGQYGKKVYKISLNGGMTCPNRDGTLGTRGCIFCSSGGSGDFSASEKLSITEQIEDAKKLVSHKTKDDSSYIAYFQAYTNTYGELSYLRSILMEAINHPDIVILSIATRPDCLNDDIIDLLMELNQIKPVWIELGLQTRHEKTAEFIRRGYTLSVFEDSMQKLGKANLEVIIHVIIGLPYESFFDILETIKYVSTFSIHGLKLQLLHILKDTDLADYNFPVLTLEEYLDILIACLELIPPNIVIHRITGDGPKNLLVAPLWSGNKKLVLNRIGQELKSRDTWQGKKAINVK
jgi:uncharacterized protein